MLCANIKDSAGLGCCWLSSYYTYVVCNKNSADPGDDELVFPILCYL